MSLSTYILIELVFLIILIFLRTQRKFIARPDRPSLLVKLALALILVIVGIGKCCSSLFLADI